MTTAPHAFRRTRGEAAGVAGGLFERHGRMVYGICRAMLRDVHEAEDATQQVFLSAYEALLGDADVREAGAWLATIARNECRARITAGMRRPLPVADEDLDGLPSSRDDHTRRLQIDELRAALAGLPERQRQAVILRYVYGLRYSEVAAGLGLSRPATEALLFRARRAMRIRLRPIVGAAIVVPTAIRDELALALPGFAAGGSGAATGLAGSLLVKLAAAPLGLKAATALVAVSTVGIVGALPRERLDLPRQQSAITSDAAMQVRSSPRTVGAFDDEEAGGARVDTARRVVRKHTTEDVSGRTHDAGSGRPGPSSSAGQSGDESASVPSTSPEPDQSRPAADPPPVVTHSEPKTEGPGTSGGESGGSGPGGGTSSGESGNSGPGGGTSGGSQSLDDANTPSSTEGSSSGPGSGGSGDSGSGSTGSGPSSSGEVTGSSGSSGHGSGSDSGKDGSDFH